MTPEMKEECEKLFSQKPFLPYKDELMELFNEAYIEGFRSAMATKGYDVIIKALKEYANQQAPLTGYLAQRAIDEFRSKNS